jgi:hypothetical protein
MTFAGMIIFFNAGKYEARDGTANHGILWAFLSCLTSALILSIDPVILAWAFAQGMFIAIAAVRVWLEDRANK